MLLLNMCNKFELSALFVCLGGGDRVIEELLCYRLLEMISSHVVTLNCSKHTNKISITEFFTEFHFFISFRGTIFWHNIAEKYSMI